MRVSIEYVIDDDKDERELAIRHLRGEDVLMFISAFEDKLRRWRKYGLPENIPEDGLLDAVWDLWFELKQDYGVDLD